MAIQIQGGVGGYLAEVDQTYKAVRASLRPIEHGAFGQYRASVNIGLVATQALNGTLMSFRWGDATRLCILQYLRIEVMQGAAATGTITPSYKAFIARSFSASDSAGTAVTLTGNSMKKQAAMGTSLVTDFRFSAALAGLTVGTRTLDANPFMELITNSTITTPNPTLYSKEFDAAKSMEHPIVLVQNEGIIIQGPSVVFGAAGTANMFVDMAWAEVAAF